MTRTHYVRLAAGTGAAVLLAGCGVASGHESHHGHGGHHTATASATETGATATATEAAPAAGTDEHDHDGADPSATATDTAPPPAARPGTITVVRGTPIENLVKDPAPAETSKFCAASQLEAGEGKDDKGGTCVSTPIGEIAKHPVRVATQPNKFFVRKGGSLKVRVVVADDQGVLDLNAFTFDESGGAGKTLHEHPQQLDANGRPLMHCHLGITTVKRPGALPGEDYDAAFSGLQGFKGDLTAKVTGLPRGSYRGDVYCSGPGHPQLATAKATQVQAFDTFDFVVTGRR
jgi:hypothetical protein